MTESLMSHRPDRRESPPPVMQTDIKGPGVTLEAMVRSLLTAIGEDSDREGLRDTPQRVTAMLTELTAGLGRDPADELSIEFRESYTGVLLVRDIPFYSLCEHHLLPFFGIVHVAYHPADGVITGLSKLARVVNIVSRRLQIQERLTREIAEALKRRLRPQGVFVGVQAEHLCMAMRGIKMGGTTTVTIEATGTLGAEQPRYQSLMAQLGAFGRQGS